MIKIHLIGQAPPKPPGPEFPFGRTKLYSWFKEIGIDNLQLFEERDSWNKLLKGKVSDKEVILAFDAIYNKFPGSNKKGHLKPTRAEILSCRAYLEGSLIEVDADIIVPIGGMAISYCLAEKSYEVGLKKVPEVKLDSVIGKEFKTKAFGLMDVKKVIIPLPHPSGASTWFYKDGNILLLNKALKLIEKNIKARI